MTAGNSKQQTASRAGRRSALIGFLFPVSFFLFPALLGCRSLPPPTPLSQLTAGQSHGHEVFQERCSLCHYDRKDDTLHGPALIGIFKKPYLHSGAPATDDRVTTTILRGRGLMPAIPALDPSQNPDDLSDLLAYLHTL